MSVTAGPPIERLSLDDRLNLDTDVGPAPVHLGAVITFAPHRPLDHLEALAELAERFSRVERLRQRPVQPRAGGGRPIWADDPELCLSHHLTHQVCPAPGDERALLDLASELLTEHLPADHPLWRAVLVSGLSSGDLALVVVAHHALADGLGGLALLAVLVDGGPPAPPLAPPRPPPGTARLVLDNVRHRVRGVINLPGRLARLPGALRAFVAGSPGHAEPTSLLCPAGSRRSVSVVRTDLASVRRAAHVAGITVNDVLLTAAGGSLGALLADRGERPASLVVSMPVSARTEETADRPDNQVSAVTVQVPIRGTPAERLRATASRTAQAKQVPRRAVGRLFDAITHALARLHLLRWVVDHQHLVHTVVTDVPGPPEPVRLLEGTVTRVVPMACTPGDIPATFVALSYAGTLTVSVISDPDGAADLRSLHERFATELDALIAT